MKMLIYRDFEIVSTGRAAHDFRVSFAHIKRTMWGTLAECREFIDCYFNGTLPAVLSANK